MEVEAAAVRAQCDQLVACFLCGQTPPKDAQSVGVLSSIDNVPSRSRRKRREADALWRGAGVIDRATGVRVLPQLTERAQELLRACRRRHLVISLRPEQEHLYCALAALALSQPHLWDRLCLLIGPSNKKRVSVCGSVVDFEAVEQFRERACRACGSCHAVPTALVDAKPSLPTPAKEAQPPPEPATPLVTDVVPQHTGPVESNPNLTASPTMDGASRGKVDQAAATNQVDIAASPALEQATNANSAPVERCRPPAAVCQKMPSVVADVGRLVTAIRQRMTTSCVEEAPASVIAAPSVVAAPSSHSPLVDESSGPKPPSSTADESSGPKCLQPPSSADFVVTAEMLKNLPDEGEEGGAVLAKDAAEGEKAPEDPWEYLDAYPGEGSLFALPVCSSDNAASASATCRVCGSVEYSAGSTCQTGKRGNNKRKRGSNQEPQAHVILRSHMLYCCVRCGSYFHPSCMQPPRMTVANEFVCSLCILEDLQADLESSDQGTAVASPEWILRRVDAPR